MAGIDAPYRDPREELRKAVFGAKPAPAAALPPPEPIPIGEAKEFPQPKLEKTPAQAPGRSPEFRAAQAGIGAMPQQPAAVPTPAAPSKVSTVASVARGALPTVAGMAAGAVQNAIDRMPQQQAAFVPPPNVPGQVPTAPTAEQIAAGSQPLPNAPAAVAPRRPLGVGPDNELTRNVANAINALPGGRAVPLGMGKISQGISSAVNNVQQVVRGAQSVQGGPLPVPAAQAAQPAPGGELPTPPQGAQFNDRRYDAANGATPADAGVVRYDPATKTYSGTDVKEGASITGGLPGGRGSGRGNVTVLPTGEGYKADLATLDLLRAERADREAGYAANQPGGGLSIIGGTTISQDLRAKTDAMSPKDILRAASQYGSRAAGAAVQAQQVQQQGESAARNAEVAARGQDVGAATARTQAAAQRDIAALQGRTSRDVARIGADGRAEAASARGSERARYTPIKLPDEVSPDGATTRSMGTALLNNDTGEIVYPGKGTGARPAPPQKDAVVQRNGMSYRFKGGDPSKPESWEKV